MLQSSLKITKSAGNDINKRKQLLASIKRKRAELKQLVIKVETLKINLQIAKSEYMVKVGSLFLKDNQLDLEIIRYRNILNLMNKGLTYDRAAEKISQTYYTQQIELDLEHRRIEQEQSIHSKREEKVFSPKNDIKKLWKKLISKFHPDLVQDNQEKIKRDIIMKQINRAYQEGDYDHLVKIDNENLSQADNTIDNMEKILVSLVNEITVQINAYEVLKSSEWYGWMEKINKAKKKNVNIFADTEKRLLYDISVKFDILKSLKLQIHEKKNVNSPL